MTLKKKPVVIAGSVLGIEEEFLPGENAFVDSEGNVVSQVVGVASQDLSRRTISVATRRSIQPVSAGDIVTGTVVLVKEEAAVLEIISAKSATGADVAVPNGTFAVPISKCENGFVKSMREKFKLGDLVRARVEAVMPWGIDVSTREPFLGVIKAYCTQDRSVLHVFDSDLRCLICGQTEQRKLSSEYAVH